MESRVARRLVRLNHEFYERFAGSFAASRAAVQPGWRRALGGRLGDPGSGSGASLLDLGCADGRLARALTAGQLPHRLVRYCGLDSSAAFLAQAAAATPATTSTGQTFAVEWVQADLTLPGWSAALPRPTAGYTTVTCFAALFHIPGHRRRLRLLEELAAQLEAGGHAVLSVWRFLQRPRLRAKIVPWSRVGLGDGDVEAGDFLLDWRRGGQGLRYVHHFAPGELERLWRRTGLRLVESFESDGGSGDLSRYVVLRRDDLQSAPAGDNG